MPEMHYVNSSNVDQVGYDEGQMELHVVFHGGALYVYQGVPLELFEQLLVAPSTGSFLNREIKNVYNYLKQ